MAKYLDDVDLTNAMICVFGKSGNFLYKGVDAWEWILEHPTVSERVSVEGVDGTFTIDEFAQELDNQETELESPSTDW